MRYDGQTHRRVATSFKVKELSGVTRPAHKGANVAILKLDDASLKISFEEALSRMQISDAAFTAMDQVSNLFSALQNSVISISMNPEEYPNAEEDIRNSIRAFGDAVADIPIMSESFTRSESKKQEEEDEEERRRNRFRRRRRRNRDTDKQEEERRRRRRRRRDPDYNKTMPISEIRDVVKRMREGDLSPSSEDLAKVRASYRKALPNRELPDVLKIRVEAVT